jgi:eukaryotic-like serine/threonine-protein kinase
MEEQERQLGVSLAGRARKLNLIGTTTHDKVKDFFAPGTRCKSVKQVFKGMGVLDDLEYAVVRSDWEVLNALERFRHDLVILRTLGKGGMGVVYQALDTNLDRIVAIKLIRPDKLASGAVSKLLKRFQREATVLAQLSDPSIVRLFEAQLHDDGSPYLVMEYVPGNSLSKVIKRVRAGEPFALAVCPPKSKLGEADALGLDGSGNLEIRKVAQWGRSLATGLHSIHGLGIVHRDVKPANILISETGKALLIDFGVAFDLSGERITDDQVTIGTALYMAPELIAGEKPSASSDVYALGVTLFEALSGKAPFYAENAMALCMKASKGDIPPLRGPKGLRPDTPEELEAILVKCLAAEAKHRYATAEEVGNDLERFLQSYVPGAAPEPAPPPEPEATSNSLVLGLIAAVALLLVIVGLLISR